MFHSPEAFSELVCRFIALAQRNLACKLPPVANAKEVYHMDRLFYLSLYELMAQQSTHLVGLIYCHLPVFHCEVILSLETRRVPFLFQDIYESVASSLLISSTLAKWTLRHTQTLYIKIARLDISQVSCSNWCIRETNQITALLASVVTFLVYDILLNLGSEVYTQSTLPT